jgi:hypothetical protein
MGTLKMLEIMVGACLVANLVIGITGIFVIRNARRLNREFEKIVRQLKS